MSKITFLFRALCVSVAFLSTASAQAEAPVFLGDVGLGVNRVQNIIRGGDTRLALMPYLAFDYGRVFARIDTFGVKTLPIAYGHLEFLGRSRDDGFDISGLAHRGNSVPLGFGTLQRTPIGAFEVNYMRDFGDSAGNIFQARYIGKIPAGRVNFYPEVGAELLDARYTNYYYGTRTGDVATGGAPYSAGAATNPYLGLMATVPLAEHWTLTSYVRRTWLDDAITRSPHVNRNGRLTMFVAVSRGF